MGYPIIMTLYEKGRYFCHKNVIKISFIVIDVVYSKKNRFVSVLLFFK